MLSVFDVQALEKDQIKPFADALDREGISQLVDWLSDQNDTLRYHALLALQSRSACAPDVFPFFDVFCDKLKSENSYQRSIGVMLIAANAKWDTTLKLDGILEDYLLILRDEKPITVRQCIQSLEQILPYKPGLQPRIAQQLMAIPIGAIKATMQKLILLDILKVLTLIRREQASEEIEVYIGSALSGGVLDQKSKLQIKKLL